MKLVDVLVNLKMITDRQEALQMIEKGSISVNNKPIRDENKEMELNDLKTIQIGHSIMYLEEAIKSRIEEFTQKPT